MTEEKVVDAIIIGGGPAGISCALELLDSCVDHLLLEGGPRLGGRLGDLDNTIRNLAAAYWDSGKALQNDLETLCHRMQVKHRTSELVASVDLKEKLVVAETSGRLKAKAIFVATGSRVKTLSFEDDKLVSDCILYDCESKQDRLAGKTVAVVGGGDNALMDALWLTDICEAVTVVHRSSNFKARPDILEEVQGSESITLLKNSIIKKAYGQNGKLQCIDVLNTEAETMEKISADYILVKIGTCPNTELLEGQLELVDGFVPIDARCQTSVPGVFAGGDIVVPGYPRIATAVGHGMMAASSIRQYLSTLK
ncbi:MAG: NAD(P)/FAD-dependent oxidoreductase [Cyanobacteria bacterium]|nr:NAD(P)/FAD-dependent oxidoreductase [Cyanobacteriota bacterium]